MEPALKQRLVGAAVLVALAVIFLPMLIKGPAPESGVGDVPLEVPPAPTGEFETRELPLLPPRTPASGADEATETAAAGALPTVDTAAERERDAAADPDAAEAADGQPEMFPPPTAGGGYAVTFGSYASQADAQRVVDALVGSQLAGYQEPETRDGRTLHRVLIGPFDSRATAEAARLRAAHVRDDVGSRVLVLDASPDAAELADEPETPAAAPAQPERPVARAEPEPEPAPAPPARQPDPPAAPEPAAASGVGFAVQVGSFSSEASAIALRDRARAQGLSSFVESVQTDSGRVHRVKVGPVADRAAAEQLKAQVKARLQMDGLVRSHP